MDVLSIVARMYKYKSANYLRPYYIEQLKSKDRYALHQLPVELVMEIIIRERAKTSDDYSREIKKKKESMTLDQRINCPHYWTFIKNNVQSKSKLSCDRYMVSFLIENLQEFSADGQNVTYTT